VSICLHRLNPGSVIFEARYKDAYTPLQPSHVEKKGLGGTEANRGDLESLPPERDTMSEGGHTGICDTGKGQRRDRSLIC